MGDEEAKITVQQVIDEVTSVNIWDALTTVLIVLAVLLVSVVVKRLIRWSGKRWNADSDVVRVLGLGAQLIIIITGTGYAVAFVGIDLFALSDLMAKLCQMLLVVFSLWLASIIVQKVIHRIGGRAELDKDVMNLLSRSARAILLIVGAVTALGTLGVDVSAIVAGLGLTGFAFGFALRDALSNLLAGMLILIYNPFDRGDRIKVAGHEGKVMKIDLRYTTICNNGDIVLIPNSTLFSQAVVILERTGVREEEDKRE